VIAIPIPFHFNFFFQLYAYDWIAVVHVEHDAVEFGLGEPEPQQVLCKIFQKAIPFYQRGILFCCKNGPAFWNSIHEIET